MSDLRPFRGLRYAAAPGPRLAGPYDVISEADRARLVAEPENIVHLTLPPGPEGERDYAAAASTFERWRREGVLVRDAQEQLYLLEERTRDGRVRSGVLGLLRLADYGAGQVLPHEHTMPGPKRDRLLLTRAVGANLEPLFFLYEDRDAKLEPVLEQGRRGDLLAQATGPDGTELTLFSLSAPDAIAAVQAFLAERPVIIADGHHRYETMLAYRDECRAGGPPGDGPHEFVLAYLVNAFDPGSEIRAIHRVLDGAISDPKVVLAGAGFSCQALAPDADCEALVERLARETAAAHAFVFVRRDGPPLLATRERSERLDVEVLHDELLPGLGGELRFDAQPQRLLDEVRAGSAALGILLHPITPADLFRVVRAGARLPKKSTFFSPKIPSGLVLRDF